MATDKKNESSNIAYRVLIEPWITEAATAAVQLNKYVFKVSKKSTKDEIKRAVEEIYKVTVLSVRTIIMPEKKRMRGRVEGKKISFKKAIVTLKDGDSINFYEGK